MLKKILFIAGVSAVTLVGALQLASEAPAYAGSNRCERILCIPCPDGYVLSPIGGNCCRCVRVG